jgi:hypothetical protein
MHLPFIMSFVLASTALSKLVLATDSADTKIEYLTPTYVAKSQTKIQIGLRWFYCAGLGISIASMGKLPSFLMTPVLIISRYHFDLPYPQRSRRRKAPVSQAVPIDKPFCSLHHSDLSPKGSWA